MTRWHKADCASPDVVVDTSKTPHCRSCNAIVSIDRIIADHVAHHVPVEIPPDEPIGQMALWWPPSVPYSSSHGNNLGNQLKDEMNKPSQAPAIPQPRPATPSPTASHSAYETTLSAEQFRLARFDALQDGSGPDHPIHIILEVFPRDDCPEYETVSYTWGGEEDDSTPCRPVFVGPYWDVLLQTSNCWDMLRYLRPRRGIRLVWIDAICINQSDAAERASQVASMRSVYQQCSRVVIFLGADLAATPPTLDVEARKHPSRHAFHEFDSVMSAGLGGQETPMTLPDLLTRRYFSRVWVIQELLLSREAIIPIAGREFWANGLTPAKYEEARKVQNPPGLGGWDWESTAVPWMRDFCGTSLHIGANFYGVLRRTWRCEATDPRDRVFGVLGLVETQTPGSSIIATQELAASALHTITPDYNISVRHAFIGILAHTLLNLGGTNVLVGAAGLAAPPNHPSWLPDLKTPDLPPGEQDSHPPHSRSPQPPASSVDLLGRLGISKLKQESVLLLTNLSLPFPELDEVVEAVKGPNNTRRDVEFKIVGPDDPISDSRCGETKMGGSWHQRQSSLPGLYDLHSWRAGATVDPSTGDLLLKAGHLLQFKSRPRKIIRRHGTSAPTGTTTMYQIGQGSCYLVVSFPKDPRLDKLVRASKNHLFYLEKEDAKDGPPEFLLLFLQELEGDDIDPRQCTRPKKFKLLLCCPYYDILVLYRSHPNDPLPYVGISQVNVRHSLYAVLTGVLDKIVESSANSTGLCLRIETNTSSYWELAGWQQMFPTSERPYLALDEILPLGQRILTSERAGILPLESLFGNAYLDLLTSRLPQHKPRVVNDRDSLWVEMTIISLEGTEYRASTGRVFEQSLWSRGGYSSLVIPWEWHCFSPSLHNTQGPQGYKERRREWRNFGDHISELPQPPKGTNVTIRARVSDLIEFVKSTNMFKQMQRLHFMFRVPENSNERPPVKVKTWAGEEDETDMILRGPQEGDHFLPERPYRPWPEEIVRDFKADGEYWDIRIS